LSVHATASILQPSARAPERVADGEGQVLVACVRPRRGADLNFEALGQREMDNDPVPVSIIARAGALYNDPTSMQGAKVLFKIGEVLVDGIADLRRAIRGFESDLE